jgi:hypothetical protein
MEMRDDLLHTLRAVRSHPAPLLGAVLTLALAIGINAAMVGLVARAFLLREDLFGAALERVRTIPGVSAATPIAAIPFSGFNVPPISVPGLAEPLGEKPR